MAQPCDPNGALRENFIGRSAVDFYDRRTEGIVNLLRPG